MQLTSDQLITNCVRSGFTHASQIPDINPLGENLGKLTTYLNNLIRLFILDKVKSQTKFSLVDQQTTVLETCLQSQLARNRFQASIDLGREDRSTWEKIIGSGSKEIRAALGSIFDFTIADVDQINHNSNLIKILQGFLVKPLIDNAIKLDIEGDDQINEELIAIASRMDNQILIPELCHLILEPSPKQMERSLAALGFLSKISSQIPSEDEMKLVQKTCSNIITNELESYYRDENKLHIALSTLKNLKHIDYDTKLIESLNYIIQEGAESPIKTQEGALKLLSLKVLHKIDWIMGDCPLTVYETLKTCLFKEEPQVVRDYATLALSQISSISNESQDRSDELIHLLQINTFNSNDQVATAAAVALINIAKRNDQFHSKVMHNLKTRLKKIPHTISQKAKDLLTKLAPRGDHRPATPNELLESLSRANERDSLPIMEALLSMGVKIVPDVIKKIKESCDHNPINTTFIDKTVDLLLALLQRPDQFIDQIHLPGNKYGTRFKSATAKLMNACEIIRPELLQGLNEALIAVQKTKSKLTLTKA